LHEDKIRLPGFTFGPAGRLRRINRLGLDAARVAVLDELAPERAADWRHRIIVIECDDGIEGELAVVHALRDDDVILAVGHVGANPGHVGAFAGIQYCRFLDYLEAEETAERTEFNLRGLDSPIAHAVVPGIRGAFDQEKQWIERRLTENRERFREEYAEAKYDDETEIEQEEEGPSSTGDS